MEKISIDSEIFESLREDIDDSLSTFITDMINYNVPTGKLSIAIKINLEKMSFTDPETGEFKTGIVPYFAHDIKCALKHESSALKGASTGFVEVNVTDGSVFLSKVSDGQTTLF